MSRPSSSRGTGFTRYLQVSSAPSRPFAPIPAGQAPYVPTVQQYTENRRYRDLMTRVYKENAPTHFANMYLEGETYLRAKVSTSLAHEVLVLDNIYNGQARQPNRLKTKHLVAQCLATSRINPADVNFILIPNIDNANTKTAINAYLGYEGWIMATELARTANSVAGQLGKMVGQVWVGKISDQPTLGFTLVTSPRATTPIPAPTPVRPGTPCPATPRAPTPVARNARNCGCIIA
ncbi:hypothetical protein VTI74DRAFT_8313 [Chaetomium olivicolor]